MICLRKAANYTTLANCSRSCQVGRGGGEGEEGGAMHACACPPGSHETLPDSSVNRDGRRRGTRRSVGGRSSDGGDGWGSRRRYTQSLIYS